MTVQMAAAPAPGSASCARARARATAAFFAAFLASAATATPHTTFPFEPMHGTPRVLADGSEEYEHEVSHPLFGTRRIAYTASYMDGVIALHQNPHVTHVACTESTLTITLDDVSAAEFWTEGSLIASTSPLWLCPHAPVRIDNKDAPDGFEMHTPAPGPFSRVVLSRDSITMLSTGQVEDGEDFDFYSPSVLMAAGTPAAAAVITFTTEDVAAPSLFKSLDLSFVRHEAPVEGHLRELRETNASLAADMEALVHEARVLAVMPHSAERARRLGWFSKAVSIVSKVVPVVAVVKAVTAVVNTVAPNIGVWSISDKYTVTFLRDDMSGQSLLSGDNADIQCMTCYTRLTGSLEINIKFNFATLTYAKVLGTVNLDMQYGAKGTFGKTFSFSKQLPAVTSEAMWKTVYTFTITVGPVPVPITLQARPSILIGGSVYGGFAMETPTLRISQTISLGFEINDAGINPIATFANSKSISGGAFSVTGVAAQIKLGAGPQVRVILFSVFPILSVSLLPNLQVRGVTGTPPPPSSVLFRRSDKDNLAKCTKGVVVSLAVGLDLIFTIPPPSFTLSVFGMKKNFVMNVRGLPKDFTFNIIPGIEFDVKGVTGCHAAQEDAQVDEGSNQGDESAEDDEDALDRLLQSSNSTACVSTNACTYVTGNWSTCSVDCGVGRRSRSVVCVLTIDGSVLPLRSCAAASYLPPIPSADDECSTPCAFSVAGASSAGVFPEIVAATLPASGYRLGQQLDTHSSMLFALTLPAGLYPAGGNPALFISSAPRRGGITFTQCDPESIGFDQSGNVTGFSGCDQYLSFAGITLCGKYPWGLKRAACDIMRTQGAANNAVVYINVRATDPSSLLPWGAPPALLNDTTLMSSLRAASALTEFTVMPYVDLVGGDQMVPISVTLPAGATSTSRHFKFHPSTTAEGVFIDALADPNFVGACDPSTVNVFVAPYDGESWPHPEDMPFSTLRTPPRPAIASTRHRTVVVTDDNFQNVAYQITVTFTANCVFSLTATDIEPIYAGIALQSRFDVNAVKMYRYMGQMTDSLFQAQVFSLSGDADIFVSRSPWRRRPGYTLTDVDFQFYSVNDAATGYPMDTITVSNVDPRFGDEWYIAVMGYGGTTEYRIAVQSYEQTEQGIAVSRLQLPLKYAQFLGSSRISPRTAARVVKGTNITQDDAGLGFIARLAVPAASYSTFDLLAGSSTRFYPAVYNGHQSLAARNVLGNVMELGGSYVDRSDVARPMIFSVASAYAGVTVASAQTADTTDTNQRMLGRGGKVTVLGPVANENGGAAVTLPDLVSPAAVDAPRTPARDTQPRSAAATPSSAAGRARRLASMGMAAGEETSALLTLNASANADFTPSTVILAPNAASGVWSSLGSCSLNANTFTTCSRVNVSAESYYMRVRIPARTNINLRITPTLVGGVTTDAAYTFVLNVGELPFADPAAASSVTSEDSLTVNTPFTAVSVDLPAPNCQFISQDAFVIVTNNNRVSPVTGAIAPMAFDVMMLATPVTAFCPSYSWSSTSWSRCSATCDNGTQTRTVYCLSSDNSVVPNGYCNPAMQPPATQTCNVGACTWYARGWSDCPVVCGGGVQVRTVECRNGGGKGNLVNDRNCNPAAFPRAQQTCNTKACTIVYWSASPWTACSATCGGGYQTRTVTCANGATGEEVDRSACQGAASIAGPEPAAQRTCGSVQCASSPYNFIYFDKRSLVPAIPQVDSIPANSRTYFSYTPPVGSSGVCVAVTTRPLSQDICGYAVQRQAFTCVIDFNGCMARAALAATQNGTAAGTYDPPSYWSIYDEKPVPPNSCGCFETVRACVAALPNCTSAAATAISVMSKLAMGCDDFNATAQPPTRSGANASVSLFATWNPAAYSVSGSQPATTFYPPSEMQNSLWTSMTQPKASVSTLIMSDWAPEDYAATENELLIAAVAGPAGADLNITVSPLFSFPATVSGTLMAPNVSAAAIRAGGLTLSITLSCDQFTSPSVALSVLNPTYERGLTSMEAALGSRLTPNLIAAGIMSTTSPASGWNQLVRPLLLNASTAVFATISADNRTISLTLPPVPQYKPSTDEALRMHVPYALMASGRTLQFPSTFSPLILTDSATCMVSRWSAWGPCSVDCNDGEQNRTRTIINRDLTRVNMASCPPLTDTQTCNTCDACAGTVCYNGGACYGGKCVCMPAWGGKSCDMPLAAGGSTYFALGSWGNCNASCGGGVQVRNVSCVLQQGLTVMPAAASACAELPMPNVTRECNPLPCDSSAPVLGMNITLALPIESINSSETTYVAFEKQLVQELAGAMGVDPSSVALSSVQDGVSLMQDANSPDTGSDNAGRQLRVKIKLRGVAAGGLTKGIMTTVTVFYDLGSKPFRGLQQANGASNSTAVLDRAAGALSSLAGLSTATRTTGTLLRTVNWTSTAVSVRSANGTVVAPATSVTTVAAALAPARAGASTSSSNSTYVSGLIAGIVIFAVLGGVAAVALVVSLARRSTSPKSTDASNAVKPPPGPLVVRVPPAPATPAPASVAPAAAANILYTRTEEGITRTTEAAPAPAVAGAV